MDTAAQIIVSGLMLGAMYALSAVGLALVWGSLNMLNMAQGALLAIGGYASYAAVQLLGLPVLLSLPFAIGVGALVGIFIYVTIVRFMLESRTFETAIIVATIGLALIMENLILKTFGAYPLAQPLVLKGSATLGEITIPYQSMLIVVVSVLALVAIAWFLGKTRTGRAIRATSQNPAAAQLMGVPVRLVFVQVLALAGGLSALSGVMLSSVTTLSPTMGYDPMTKAFIICVIAGLGSSMGALWMSFILGMLEASVQYLLGVRFAFPMLLLLVIVTLIWRPDGVFGRGKAVRL